MTENVLPQERGPETLLFPKLPVRPMLLFFGLHWATFKGRLSGYQRWEGFIGG